MSFLYVTENGASIGVNGGKIVVTYSSGEKDTIPKETVEGISIFGRSQLTAAMTQYSLENGIRVSYFSESGHFYGTLTPTDKVNIFRLKRQIYLSEVEGFCLSFSRAIVSAKISNQITVIRRYARENGFVVSEMLRQLSICKNKINSCKEIPELMGYEGKASKLYFSILSDLVDSKYKFSGRSRRPARDPFNAMLNIGYSLLAQEIHGELENRGICAYVGFMHKDKANHVALASDMIEEWRPVLVDSTVLSLICGNEISIEEFSEDENGGCSVSKKGIGILIAKFEKKMYTENRYLKYIEKPLTFREALWHQCEMLAKAIDTENADIYQPIVIR